MRKIILLKLASQQDSLLNNRFLQGIIFDALFALKEVKNNERYFYFNIRSLLENLMRFILKLKNNDKTGILQLNKQFSKLKFNHYEKLTTIYTKACNFVHNNELSDLKLIVYYQEINEVSNLCIEKQEDLSLLLRDIGHIISESLVHTYPNQLVNVFPMNINDLYHLLGEEYSNSLKESLD